MNRYAAHGSTMAHPAGSYVRHADAMAAIAALEAENADAQRRINEIRDDCDRRSISRLQENEALEAENAKLRRALDDALDFIRGQSGQAAKYFKSARRIEGGE